MVKLHSYDEEIAFVGFDEYVKQTFPEARATLSRFDQLIHHLTRGIPKENLHKELFLTRGFIVCLSIVKADNDSIFSLDGRVWNSENTAKLFYAFCSSAGIESHVIGGRVKATNYKVGSTTIEGGWHKWGVFKENNKWHLIDPQWCVSCVINYSRGDEIMIENDGKKTLKKIGYSSGLIISEFDEDWFCTSPEVFNIHHYPDDPKWQLCAHQISLDEWLALPMLNPDFFKFRLHLLSKSSARLESENGKCLIQVMAEKKIIKQLILSNRLFLSTSDSSNISAEDWPLLVMSGRDKSLFIFEIRFPMAGTYRFEIHVGRINESLSQCCEFSIQCDKADPNCKKLPVDTGLLGYGFGSIAEENGLSKPSQSGPKILVNPEGKNSNLTFKVEKDAMKELEYGSVIFTDGEQKCDILHLNKSRRLLKLDANIATDDTEYALMVGKRPINSNAAFDPLLFYLVSTGDDPNYRYMIETARSERRSILNEQKKEEKLEKRDNLLDRRRQLVEIIQELQSDENLADSQKVHSQVERLIKWHEEQISQNQHAED